MTPDTGTGTTDGRWSQAWAAALDDLELTLVQIEQLLAGDQQEAPTPAPWQPPVLDSPLPPEMLDRATALLGRQRVLIDRTTAAMGSSRQHSALLGRMSDANGPRRSEHAVYLDVRA